MKSLSLAGAIVSVALIMVPQRGSAQPAAQVGIVDPASGSFPESSIVDYSFLLDAPAGRHGFALAGNAGELRFQDDTRARFWGIAIDQESVSIPREEIDRILNVIARAGVNLIRFADLDRRLGREGVPVQNIIDETAWAGKSSEKLDKDFQDRLDYWVAAAKKRGIYSSFVFRSARQFRTGDGVANADSLEPGGGMEAIFDDRLIRLQKNFIDAVFADHRNPYTGLTYINEPAVAVVEIAAQADLFSRPSDWISMPAPYRTEFDSLWNEWLKDRYGSTTRLRAAWTNSAGIQALRPGESLDHRTVHLPTMDDTAFDQAILVPYHDPLRSPARRADAVRFAQFLVQRYFESLRDFCRDRGIRVPLAAGLRADRIPLTTIAARELGTTSIAYNGSSLPTPTTTTAENVPTETGLSSIAPVLAISRWYGKPLFVSEWSIPWPTASRVTGPLDVAAVCLFQGVDLVVCNGYQTKGEIMTITPEGIQSDPVRWGLFGLAARLFLRGDVQQARQTVAVRYSADDLATFSSFPSALYSLAWNHRVVNVFEDEGKGADLTITSGRSHTDEVDGERVILYSRSPYVEAQKQQVVQTRNSLYARAGYALPINVFRSDSFAVRLDNRVSWVHARYGFRSADLRGRNLEPFGVDRSGKFSLGFLDSSRQVLGLGAVAESDAYGIAREMMQRWAGSTGNEDPFRSDTGELWRDPEHEIASINTPGFCALYGTLKTGQVYDVGTMRVVSQSPIAAVAAASLDGKPLVESQRIAVKMATIAENTSQPSEAVLASGEVRKFRGTFPVTTEGKASEQPTSVWIGGRKLADVYMLNGTWEFVLEKAKKEIDCYCDTPLIRFRVLPDEVLEGVNVRVIGNGGDVSEEKHSQQEFLYPPFARAVMVSLPH